MFSHQSSLLWFSRIWTTTITAWIHHMNWTSLITVVYADFDRISYEFMASKNLGNEEWSIITLFIIIPATPATPSNPQQPPAFSTHRCELRIAPCSWGQTARVLKELNSVCFSTAQVVPRRPSYWKLRTGDRHQRWFGNLDSLRNHESFSLD